MKKFTVFFSLIIIFSLFLCACGTHSISFKYDIINDYGIGETVELTSSDFECKQSFNLNELSFQSSNKEIATTKNNYIKCLNSGETEISLFYKNKFQDKIILKVQKEPQNLNHFSISNTKIELEKGEQITIKDIVSISPIEFKNSIVIKSSNEDIVSVFNDKIYARNNGEATLTVLIPKSIQSAKYIEKQIDIMVKQELYVHNFSFTNLVNDKLIFYPNESGNLKFDADIPIGANINFYSNNNLLSLSSDGSFNVGTEKGKGTITAKYKNGFADESYAEKKVNFEIVDIIKPKVTISLDNIAIKDYEYVMNIETNDKMDNFILGEDIAINETTENLDNINIKFKFEKSGVNNLKVEYKNIYSYETKLIEVINKDIKVLDVEKFNFEFNCNDIAIETLDKLYLTKNNFYSKDYPNESDVDVYYEEEKLDINVENLSSDIIKVEGNKIKPLKEGTAKINVKIGDFEKLFTISVSNLKATKIIYECETKLFLNSDNDRTNFTYFLDLPNVINNEIQVLNQTEDIIEIINDKIIAKAVGVGVITLSCGDVIQEVKINVEYAVTNFNLVLDGSTIQINEIILTKGESHILSIELKSEDIILEGEYLIDFNGDESLFEVDSLNFYSHIFFKPKTAGVFNIRIIECKRNIKLNIKLIVV